MQSPPAPTRPAPLHAEPAAPAGWGPAVGRAGAGLGACTGRPLAQQTPECTASQHKGGWPQSRSNAARQCSASHAERTVRHGTLGRHESLGWEKPSRKPLHKALHKHYLICPLQQAQLFQLAGDQQVGNAGRAAAPHIVPAPQPDIVQRLRGQQRERAGGDSRSVQPRLRSLASAPVRSLSHGTATIWPHQKPCLERKRPWAWAGRRCNPGAYRASWLDPTRLALWHALGRASTATQARKHATEPVQD